jgi:hypothetical protein
MNKEIDILIYNNDKGNSLLELEKGMWINIFPENCKTPIDRTQMIKAKIVIPMPEPKGEITVSQFSEMLKDIECSRHTGSGMVIDKWYKTLFGERG